MDRLGKLQCGNHNKLQSFLQCRKSNVLFADFPDPLGEGLDDQKTEFETSDSEPKI